MMVASRAQRSRLPASSSPRWSSIIAAASICAEGFAIPFPAMSGAEPCTGSKMAAWVPMLAPGASPRPPTNPAASSERMSPNRLVVTMTSNCSGLITSCMAVLSTILSSDAIDPAYCSATRRATSRNSPDVLVPPARHDRLGGPHVGVEIELLTHRDIDRAVAAPHRSRQRAFQAETGAAYRIERRIGKRRAGLLDGGHAAVLLVPIELHPQRVEYLESRFGDLGADPITPDERGLANRQGRPGVRLFTARVRAVQGSSPSPRAIVRHPILPMRESMSTTESSAVARAGVRRGVAPGLATRNTRPAGTITYRPPTNPISVRRS